jgi:hypothetical protein
MAKKPQKKNGNKDKYILITVILSLVTALINLVAGILKAIFQ